MFEPAGRRQPRKKQFILSGTKKMSSDLVVVVTGANQGVGFDACRQFALAPRVAKVVLTCRSPDKANRAIEALATATGKDKSLFDFVVLDLDSRDSATKAVDALPAKIDRLVLNAGAVTAGTISFARALILVLSASPILRAFIRSPCF